MPGPIERSALHVEGLDDLHTITNLLIKHGIRYDLEPPPSVLPEIRAVGGVDKLLAGITRAVSLSTERAMGSVLDANSPIANRWQAVRDQLEKAGVDAPHHPEIKGFIGESPTYRAKVGVWLMPDNRRDGTLEHFLRALIADSDLLIDHAESATARAKTLGAEFTDADKATVHAWLAWQKDPGRPYGQAIKAQYFLHDTPVAGAFAAWFKALYDIP